MIIHIHVLRGVYGLVWQHSFACVASGSNTINVRVAKPDNARSRPAARVDATTRFPPVRTPLNALQGTQTHTYYI